MSTVTKYRAATYVGSPGLKRVIPVVMVLLWTTNYELGVPVVQAETDISRKRKPRSSQGAVTIVPVSSINLICNSLHALLRWSEQALSPLINWVGSHLRCYLGTRWSASDRLDVNVEGYQTVTFDLVHGVRWAKYRVEGMGISAVTMSVWCSGFK